MIGQASPFRKSARLAFTLLELLVVVGITAILIGILLPVISRAQEKAREARCASNLHQIGEAIFGYLAINQNRVPVGDIVQLDLSQPPDAAEYLPALLQTNVGASTQIYHCPGDSILYPICGGSYSYYYPPQGSILSEQLWYDDFYHHASTKLLAEDFDTRFLIYTNTSGQAQQLNIPMFHAGGLSNHLFADLHVDAF